MSWFLMPTEPPPSPSAIIEDLRQHLESEPKRSDGMRYEALRLAADNSPYSTPDEVVERARAYFNFLKGE